MTKTQKRKKIFHARPLFYGFLALLLSISTAKCLFSGEWLYIIFDIFALLAFLVYALIFKKFAAICIVFGAFALGLGLFPLGMVTFRGNTFSGIQSVVGRVSDDISFGAYGNSATVILKDVVIDGKVDKNIRLEISIESESDISAGDILVFDAKIKNAKLFTLGNFNSYYLRDRTPYTAEISAKDISVQGNRLSADESFRLKIKEVLYENMGKENGAVAFAAIFGDKTDVDADTYNAYDSAGILHLLTVSGLHVGVLFAFLGWILKKCRIKNIFNFLICGTVLGLYAWLCNFTPSVLRAGIMALTMLFTRFSGRSYDNLSSLGFAGILILLFSPLSALDLGFLLSFSCVLSIFLLAPVLSKWFEKVFPKFVATSFSVSIALQLGIVPFLGEMWASLNFLTAFVNLLVIPLFSLIFPILVSAALLTAGLPFLGFLLSACGFGLGVIKSVASFFGQTHLIVTIGPQDLFVVGALLVLLFCISHFFMAKRTTKAVCCSCLFALGSLFYGLTFIENPQKSTFAYCQNYSTSVVLLTNENGKSAVVDLTGEKFMLDAMKRLGIKRAQTLFVLQDNTVEVDSLQVVGVETIVRPTEGEGFDNEEVVSDELWRSVNGFSFRYRFENKRLLGLEISFDGIKIFVLRDWSISENALQTLGKEEYDFALLGQHDEYAKHFSSNIYAYDAADWVDKSFERDGNMAVKILDESSSLKLNFQKSAKNSGKMHKKFVWRCLD